MSAQLRGYEIPGNLDHQGIPFTDLYNLHPLADQDAVAAFWERPPFPIGDRQKRMCFEALASVEEQQDSLMTLPRQFVHHDLLVFNLLAVDGAVTGVLDFDFLAVDIAALEFAISLNHVLKRLPSSPTNLSSAIIG